MFFANEDHTTNTSINVFQSLGNSSNFIRRNPKISVQCTLPFRSKMLLRLREYRMGVAAWLDRFISVSLLYRLSMRQAIEFIRYKKLSNQSLKSILPLDHIFLHRKIGDTDDWKRQFFYRTFPTISGTDWA